MILVAFGWELAYIFFGYFASILLGFLFYWEPGFMRSKSLCSLIKYFSKRLNLQVFLIGIGPFIDNNK